MRAFQSNTRGNHPAELANDGNLNTFSVAENDVNGETWWEVDLGSMHSIDHVEIAAPTDEKCKLWFYFSLFP